MFKQEKLPSTNSTKSGAHLHFAKILENEHTPGLRDRVETLIRMCVCHQLHGTYGKIVNQDSIEFPDWELWRPRRVNGNKNGSASLHIRVFRLEP